MINRETIDSLLPHIAYDVRKALATLSRSGVLQAQQEANHELLVKGPVDESDADLAERIRIFRQRSLALSQLTDLASSYETKEDENEQA